MKLVYESVGDVLKPKSHEVINDELDRVIDDFVRKVQLKDFLSAFDQTNDYKKDGRKLVQGKKISFLTTVDSFFHIIDTLSMAVKLADPEDWDEFASSKYPEFLPLWKEIATKPLGIKDSYWTKIFERIMEKLALKFNVDY